MKSVAHCTRAFTPTATCAWLGGRCVHASARDCVEPWEPTGYYGEGAGFERACGSGSDSICSGYATALRTYANMHAAATREQMSLTDLSSVRVMVIRDYWKNVGMGFMPGQVANMMHYALATNLILYFDNYGRYDWSKYFYGWGGLDLRWSTAKETMWARRFRHLGMGGPHLIEVLHDDDPSRGDEDWEEHLVPALANRSIHWLQLDGVATTVNWYRVLLPALARTEAELPKPLPALWKVLSARHNGNCGDCSLWAMFRPRAVMRAALDGSPLASGAPLACLKARTMYAEDKRFWPDELPLTLQAADQLWSSYPSGDDTHWGPRTRLRCVRVGGGTSARAAHSRSVAHAPRRAHLGRGGAGGAGGAGGSGAELISPSEALGCMRAVAQGLGDDARLFVAVDAPALQKLAFQELGGRAFITLGVGIDPTNEYRDGVLKRRPSLNRTVRRGDYAGQVLGRQELVEKNLLKVSLDYFIQGFCLSSLTLRPSAFYAAAVKRTRVLKEYMVKNMNWTSRGAAARGAAARGAAAIGAAARGAAARSEHASASGCMQSGRINTCVKRRCHLASCSNAD
tara:strand:+ start:280 stop:1992 length:1713 start_codon:yes stop_codon:yes gene_type:complete